MLKYTVKKILGMIPMLLIITFIIYWLLDLTPGDPTSYLMDPESLARLTNEQMAALRAQYGLDDPFVIRYFKWLFRILQGDFGYSTSSGVPVIQIMAQRLPATLELAVAAYQACHFLGVPECNVHLTQAVTYLSLAPKSNAMEVAYNEAKKDAVTQLAEPVPLNIRNAPTRLMQQLDYGKGYMYAHDYKDKLTAMQCLPDSLVLSLIHI